MSIRPFRDIKRRKTKEIKVGKVKVGGNNPISVQSMTNTLTTDIKATINQINEIHSEGADIVRVSCPDESSSKSLKEIIKHVDVPIVADIHFHFKRAIEASIALLKWKCMSATIGTSTCLIISFKDFEEDSSGHETLTISAPSL